MKEPKPPSTLGVLLGPDLGASWRPVAETTSIFVNLIAMVFASFQLFPRNHPSLTGAAGAPRLTLPLVIQTAWRQLSFTQEGLPQVMIFFAVVGCLAVSALAAVTIVFSLFIGHAHAQPVAPPTGGYFAPVDPDQDIALGWMNYIFQSTPMMNYLNNYGQVIPQSTVIQGALITALGFYSSAILVIAAALLFYHLASMVVETAHHGVVMGKRANQIWAPIRLVVAIGLLVPVSYGLNTGQFIVIKIAEWGSNLASQTWSIFVHQLAYENYGGVVPNVPYVRKTVYDFVMMEACACAYNSYMQGAGGCGAIGGAGGATGTVAYSFPTLAAQIAVQAPDMLPNGAIKYRYDLPAGQEILKDQGACGSYTLPPTPQANTRDPKSAEIQTNIQQVRDAALAKLIPAVQAYVGKYMTYFVPKSVGGKDDEPYPVNTGDFETLVHDYEMDLQSRFQSKATTDFSQNMPAIADTSAAQGWVTAGAWFNTIARAQEDIMDTDNLLPGTQPPSIVPSQGTNSIYNNVLMNLNAFEEWMSAEQPPTPTAPPNTQQEQLMLAAAGMKEDTGKSATSDHKMDRVFAIVDWVAQWDGVWRSAISSTPTTIGAVPTVGDPLTPQTFSLGVQFTGANPLAEIAAFGHANINCAYELFDLYLNILALGNSVTIAGKVGTALAQTFGIDTAQIAGNLLTGFTEQALQGIGGIFTIISLIFFTSGVVLAFLLPLIPFFRFLFNVLVWIISVIEAVIAIPLVALAHLNPEGEGLHGATGKSAYHFMFNIFLRPVLMVFGLIVGLMIFYVAASLMNMTYMIAVVGSGGIAHGHLFLSRLIYSLMYVFVLYMCANNAFKMISWLPTHAMKWMGGQSMHFDQMGDPGELLQPMTLATSYADQGIVSGVGRMGPGAVLAQGVLSGNMPLSKVANTIGSVTNSIPGVPGINAPWNGGGATAGGPNPTQPALPGPGTGGAGSGGTSGGTGGNPAVGTEKGPPQSNPGGNGGNAAQHPLPRSADAPAPSTAAQPASSDVTSSDIPPPPPAPGAVLTPAPHETPPPPPKKN